ncbi:LysR substrate-binding domain-containing protein [Comamonas antarctica]|uniref:LysR family transcriptional regulator n=1 Tax=Comamonas antarctica TaxID=2743470 RepID=A0A6N1X3P3_9BURK|nr:LysR substrate-binding domain-containing protein [Comamonas antarctica]QKV53887.1 LysR family transcriptional regulator [Comamonas antarctica]
MRDLDLTTLRLFVAVCEQRSIAAAGLQQAMVGSAISKRLAQLEHQIGTQLLVRKRRGVQPTPAGETLLEHARALLARSELVARDMAGYAHGTRGHVRLLVTASVIQVSLEERVSPEVARGVREGSASVGICWDAADLEGLQTESYRGDHLAICAHASHPIAQRERVHFADALEHEYVNMPALSAVQQMLTRAAAVHGKVLQYRMQVSHFEAALRVVRANLAISVVPVEIAQPFARAYGLRLVPLADDWARRRFAICYRSRDQLSPAARLLVAHLHACGPAHERAAAAP